MNIKKLFDSWIGKEFRGLSARTLYQFIMIECIKPFSMYSKEDADEMVYIQLYQYFTGKRTDELRNNYELIKFLVENCTWL